MSETAGEKTFAPSEKRLRDAANKGDVLRSKDLGTAVVMLVGAAWLAFSHGTNDGQKSMGIITLVLVLGGFLPAFQVPYWVMLLCASAITLGTMAGGWRIVRTVGFGIYKLRPLHGLGSQLAAAAVIGGAAWFGGPVSTTHVVSSAVMGVGAADRPRAVRWGKAGEVLFTWLVTLPVAGLLGALTCYLLEVLL